MCWMNDWTCSVLHSSLSYYSCLINNYCQFSPLFLSKDVVLSSPSSPAFFQSELSQSFTWTSVVPFTWPASLLSCHFPISFSCINLSKNRKKPDPIASLLETLQWLSVAIMIMPQLDICGLTWFTSYWSPYPHFPLFFFPSASPILCFSRKELSAGFLKSQRGCIFIWDPVLFSIAAAINYHIYSCLQQYPLSCRSEGQRSSWAWPGFLLSVSQGRAAFLPEGSGHQSASKFF